MLIGDLSQNILAVLVGTGAFRTITGYIENVIKDGVVTKYELCLGGATLSRVGVMVAAFYLPLNALGIDQAALAAGGSALVLDLILHAFKVKKPEEKK